MARRPSDHNKRTGKSPSNGRRLVVIPTGTDHGPRSIVPPHLSRVSWIAHEKQAALTAFRDLRTDLKALKKKISEPRVHKARVTLRRWLSVWKVLKEDGWETEQYQEQIGKPLRKLQKLLGGVRDLDVNIEQGERLGCRKREIEGWKKDRDRAEQKLEKWVDKNDIGKIINRLAKYIRSRAEEISIELPRAKAEQSAFDHIEFYLLKQESIVKEQAETAHTPEEFHQLRLAIKRWRYLLTEFFGLTNLELVRAQQILGQMHDLDRLTPLLVHEDDEQEALEKLKKKRKELMREIEDMRQRLPYGLRPEMVSLEPALSANLV